MHSLLEVVRLYLPDDRFLIQIAFLCYANLIRGVARDPARLPCTLNHGTQTFSTSWICAKIQAPKRIAPGKYCPRLRIVLICMRTTVYI